MSILNIAAYKFVHLAQDTLPNLKAELKHQANSLGLKGTILLSAEGINLFLAGESAAIADFQAYLAKIPAFADLHYKESWSTELPFKRMWVKIKAEIIPFNAQGIEPEKFTAPRLTPEQLKKWYEEKHDMIVLDTRNDYEIRIGKFENAVQLNLKHFRDFPNATRELLDKFKNTPIVTYCTGGIRCEKAAAWMLQEGFKEVYQLDGGILNYFEKVGGEHYEGECFVFDNRTSVKPNLEETQAPLCTACQNPLIPEERISNKQQCQDCQ